MPSTQPRRRRVVETPKTETLDDLDIKEVKPRSPRQKEIDVGKILGGTISDKVAATAAFRISGSMLKTVGRQYAITPKEAYNITHPSVHIIGHYIPITSIKTKFPLEIANDIELILVTFAEYLTRILATFTETEFRLTLVRFGMVPRQAQESTPIQNTPERKDEVQPLPVPSQEDLAEIIGDEMMPHNGVPADGQVARKPSGFSFQDLIDEGVIPTDMGDNMS